MFFPLYATDVIANVPGGSKTYPGSSTLFPAKRIFVHCCAADSLLFYEERSGAERRRGEINATRDVSDYTLMAYCIEKDIPVFAVCH